MTTIVYPGFENIGPPWAAINQGSGCSSGVYTTWYTEGSQSLYITMAADANRIASDYNYYSQDITIDSDFSLKMDFNVLNASTYYEVRVYMDNDLLFSTAASPTGVTINQAISISGYSSGIHTLKLGLYCITTSTTEHAKAAFDNLRIESETNQNKYVDIATGSDSDSGNTWALAYLTVKKGIDNVGSIRILRIAEGDYSAQAAIDLDKNLNIICEDYGGGNASPPLTVKLPVTV